MIYSKLIVIIIDIIVYIIFINVIYTLIKKYYTQ